MGAKMRDIAARAGTSIAAVSVTLNGAKSKTLGLSASTRDRIMKAADELGYRRNPNAGALATGRTHILGLMFPSLEAYAEHDPFYSLIANGVTGAASARGYNLMLYSATAEDQGGKAAGMIDKRIDGLVLVSPPYESPIYEECERQDIPVVDILGNPNGNRLCVLTDDYQGGRMAARHLLDLGHRRIGHLEGKMDVSTSEPRRQGFLDEIHEHGLESEHLCRPAYFNRQGGYLAASELMKLPAGERPTAIFAANDLSAHGAIDAVHNAGLSVPSDVSVVGYDDT